MTESTDLEKRLMQAIASERKAITQMVRGHHSTVGNKDYWKGRQTEIELIYRICKGVVDAKARKGLHGNEGRGQRGGDQIPVPVKTGDDSTGV